MVLLHCRECGAEIQSNTKQTKCPKCSTLFPFACNVCSKLLTPPIPDYPIERYFTADNKPLCADHYQRQCPECSKWFQADENPGYFLCKECSVKRGSESAATAASTTSSSDAGDGDDFILARTGPDEPARPRSGARTAAKAKTAANAQSDPPASQSKKGCGAGMLCFIALITVTCMGWRLLDVASIFKQ